MKISELPAGTAADTDEIPANQTGITNKVTSADIADRASLTGDVTKGRGSTATTIADDAVTYAKMQNISATSRLLGRITAGAGNIEELTGTQATTLLDTFTAGARGLVPGPSGFPGFYTLRADQTWGDLFTHKVRHENNGSDEISVAGLSGLLADGQTPLTHATSHKSGGSDNIKLDELAAPTDVTTLNASTSAHGLMQKYPNIIATFLNGAGTFTAPPAAVLANANTADVVATGVDTYLTGSNVLLAGRIKSGTTITWTLGMTKTAAGTATPVFNVRFGTLGTTSDPARNTFTGVSQTAATDTGKVEIVAIIRSFSASGTVHGSLEMHHFNTTTGLQNKAQVQLIQNVSAAFDLTVANLRAGISMDPGTSGVWTFQNVSVVVSNLN